MNKQFNNTISLTDTSKEYIKENFSHHNIDCEIEELQKILVYDTLNILFYFYDFMDGENKDKIKDYIENRYDLYDIESLYITYFKDEKKDKFHLYTPISCSLSQTCNDEKIKDILFTALFNEVSGLAFKSWNKDSSYSTYMILLCVAYFEILHKRLNSKKTFNCFSSYPSYANIKYYDDFVDKLYLDNNNYTWDENIDLNFIDDLFEINTKIKVPPLKVPTYDRTKQIIEKIITTNYLCINYNAALKYIKESTNINISDKFDINNFSCYLCTSEDLQNKYIIVSQANNRFTNIVETEDAWESFEKNLYNEISNRTNNNDSTTIIYLMDDDPDNIPIQKIESNHSFYRKYVFSPDETVTFINGIITKKDSKEHIVSPVKDWEDILQEEHLTGCLTQLYSSKRVNSYLDGEPFDCDYLDKDSNISRYSHVPQIKWIKSLDTYDFREFCFDNLEIEFGQINLLYGANGSGKTSVLEGIEYALTSNVRRIKDFKIKMPPSDYPSVQVYGTNSRIYDFDPSYAKEESKEIEKEWYGIPIGRTKTNLNENFNRFNSFDSEAAYNFIHSSDTDSATFETMFGNLMFGDNIVGYEKKWKRFQKAFEDVYSELRDNLNNSKFNQKYYEEILDNHNNASNYEEINSKFISLHYNKTNDLSISKVFNTLNLLKKYVQDIEDLFPNKHQTFDVLEKQITTTKNEIESLLLSKQKNIECISALKDNNLRLKQENEELKDSLHVINSNISLYTNTLSQWETIENILKNKKTIQLVFNLADELETINKNLNSILKMERYPLVIKFLKMGNFSPMDQSQKLELENSLIHKKDELNKLELEFDSKKKNLKTDEQLMVELKKHGKALIKDNSCPLCGHKYNCVEELLDLINNVNISNLSLDDMINEIQEKELEINNLETTLSNNNLILNGKKEIQELLDISFIKDNPNDYEKIYAFYCTKKDIEKRKHEIEEQQIELSAQGFSVKNINDCQEFKNSNDLYLKYLTDSATTFDEYISQLIEAEKNLQNTANQKSEENNYEIQQNIDSDILLHDENESIDAKLESLSKDNIQKLDIALKKVKNIFSLEPSDYIDNWTYGFYELFDLVESEKNDSYNQEYIDYAKDQIQLAQNNIKITTPKLERCSNAILAFKKLKPISSYVETSINNNIHQIDKFFRWMHHSGEFIKLGIDTKGIYAIRGINNEKIRTYEMSTGQRATIAMSVMFTLHLAAPNAPQFLLLDEPLATMDDTQVLNVLDILKLMAMNGTQIFFTSANGVMIDLFRKCFTGTDLDYKEFYFVKHVNMPSVDCQANLTHFFT